MLSSNEISFLYHWDTIGSLPLGCKLLFKIILCNLLYVSVFLSINKFEKKLLKSPNSKNYLQKFSKNIELVISIMTTQLVQLKLLNVSITHLMTNICKIRLCSNEVLEKRDYVIKARIKGLLCIYLNMIHYFLNVK